MLRHFKRYGQTRRKPLGGQRGLTLIEVMAAIIVLALGVLGLAPLAALSITGNQFSDQVTAAVASAQESIEQRLQAAGFGAIPYVDTTEVAQTGATLLTVVRDASVDASIPPRLYEISVTAMWMDDADVRRSLTFVSYTPIP